MLARRRYIKTFLLSFLCSVIILMVIGPLVIWTGFIYPDQMMSLAQIIAQNFLLFTLLRWCIILLVFYTWPRFVRYRAKKRFWKPEKTMYWLNQRLKITIWLIMFEVLICENFLVTLISLLVHH